MIYLKVTRQKKTEQGNINLAFRLKLQDRYDNNLMHLVDKNCAFLCFLCFFLFHYSLYSFFTMAISSTLCSVMHFIH